jgi:acyl-coenzyme A thioesterase PaaI-like protein
LGVDVDYDETYQDCFVCGKENLKGLQLNFYHDAERGGMVTRCRFGSYMQGYRGIVHGGFVSMLLDEVMAKACLQRGITAVTAQFEARFRKPVHVDEEVEFHGTIVELKGKTIRTEARCTGSDGVERAGARAIFFRQ